MKKVTSLLLTVVLLATMLSVFAVPAFAVTASDRLSHSADVNLDDAAFGLVVTSTNINNVITFSSFDIAVEQTVQFDANNYLILVNDTEPTRIDGRLIGGGNIYIVNPNGVLFDNDSSVNVGNLYISASRIDDEQIANFTTSGTEPLEKSLARTGDVVILGAINANSIFLEGTQVYLDHTYVSTSSSNITIRSHQDTVTGAGSILSEGYPWTIITIAAAVVFGLGGFILGRKRKPVLVGSTDNIDEE